MQTIVDTDFWPVNIYVLNAEIKFSKIGIFQNGEKPATFTA